MAFLKRPHADDYLVTFKEPQNPELKDAFNDATKVGLKEVRKLIKANKASKEVKINEVMPTFGVIAVTCNEAFAKKIEALPCVAAIEKQHTFHV